MLKLAMTVGFSLTSRTKSVNSLLRNPFEYGPFQALPLKRWLSLPALSLAEASKPWRSLRQFGGLTAGRLTARKLTADKLSLRSGEAPRPSLGWLRAGSRLVFR